MFSAFDFIAESVPQASMLLTGYVKYLSRNPPPDEDIRSSIEWALGLLSRVLDEPVVVDVESGYVVSLVKS